MNHKNNFIEKGSKDESKRDDTEAIDIDQGHSNRKSDQNEISFYHEKALQFMKTLKKDYKRLALIYNSCLVAEQERERKNKEEILQIKKIYHQMQNEKINIKRKKWCRYCESEATYLSSEGNKFYCSKDCEEKQKEFASIIDRSFKT